jgi:hypothetical protein
MLALAVLAILYDNVDLVWGWVVIDGVLGARTLNDIEEGRCLTKIISLQGREPKQESGCQLAAWALESHHMFS